MNRLLSAAALCGLLLPAAAPAQLALGARAAIALPVGSTVDGAPTKDSIARAFPLEVRAGWRLEEGYEVGLVGGYAPASVADPRKVECTAQGLTCAAHLWRVAARGEYALREGEWRPFAAVALGWEWQVQRWEIRSDNWERTSWNGWLAGIEAGVDRPLASHFDGGVFAGLSFGQYRSVSVEGETAGYAYQDAREVASPALHGWLTIGLRGTFGL